MSKRRGENPTQHTEANVKHLIQKMMGWEQNKALDSNNHGQKLVKVFELVWEIQQIMPSCTREDSVIAAI